VRQGNAPTWATGQRDGQTRVRLAIVPAGCGQSGVVAHDSSTGAGAYFRCGRRASAELAHNVAMPSIELREVTDANRAAIEDLHAGPAEGRFVSSVADSLEEAAEEPEGSPWYRAVYEGGEPVGFVMLSWNVTPRPPDIIGPWFLWKLIVDERHQGRGIGRAIVESVVELIRAEGATELFTSHVLADGGPDGFYERLGFVPTGAHDPQGERILRLDLGPRLSVRDASSGPDPS
jgi:diamine N-acetyltransferase